MRSKLQWLALLFFFATPLLVASPSRMKIAADNEPGQRMILTGRVFGADGKPRGGIQIYAYHTDAKGLYRPDGSFGGEPRLRGTLVTDDDGSYTIDTIKPAPYPGRKIPAHIHLHLRRPGVDQEEELQFDGNGPNICKLHQDSGGVLRCTHDFRLRSGS